MLPVVSEKCVKKQVQEAKKRRSQMIHNIKFMLLPCISFYVSCLVLFKYLREKKEQQRQNKCPYKQIFDQLFARQDTDKTQEVIKKRREKKDTQQP